MFRAIDGTYTLTAYGNYKFVQVYSGTASEPSTLQADGTGAIWVIGGNGINKPFLSTKNNNGWWTGTEWDQATAQIKEKVYQITLTVGKQLSATDVNFKFFGQPNWGTEFKGDGSDYSLVCNSDVFGVGDGNGHEMVTSISRKALHLTRAKPISLLSILLAAQRMLRLPLRKVRVRAHNW